MLRVKKKFVDTFEKHALKKIKTFRGNQKPHTNKKLRKAIMKRSQLKKKANKTRIATDVSNYKKQNGGNTGSGQGVIQSVFEIGNRFWARENWRPNFDKLTKNKVFTKPLITKHRPNHKLPPMYIKHCKPVF